MFLWGYLMALLFGSPVLRVRQMFARTKIKISLNTGSGEI